MDWMHNRYHADYKRKYSNLCQGIERLYGALGIVRLVPEAPATRRFELDKGKTINLGETK